MALANAGKDAILTSGIAGLAYLGLANNAVGSGSTGELSGGSPAYARKAASWGAPSAGVAALNTQPVFDVPAATVARAMFWSASTAGTYLGDAELTDEVFAAQGTYTITSGSVTLT